MITIPTYEEARNRVLSGTYSHLDWFVVEHEPGGVIGEEKFRTELANVIDEVIQKCHESGRGYAIWIDAKEEEQTEPEDKQMSDMVVAATMAIIFILASIILLSVGEWATK